VLLEASLVHGCCLQHKGSSKGGKVKKKQNIVAAQVPGFQHVSKDF